MTGLMECEAAGVFDVAGADLRGADRFPMRSFVRVCLLENSGTGRVLAAEGLNISATGMAFETCERLTPGTSIQVQLPTSGLSSPARVRNSKRRAWGWRVGVEFAGPLA